MAAKDQPDESSKPVDLAAKPFRSAAVIVRMHRFVSEARGSGGEAHGSDENVIRMAGSAGRISEAAKPLEFLIPFVIHGRDGSDKRRSPSDPPPSSSGCSVLSAKPVELAGNVIRMAGSAGRMDQRSREARGVPYSFRHPSDAAF